MQNGRLQVLSAAIICINILRLIMPDARIRRNRAVAIRRRVFANDKSWRLKKDDVLVLRWIGFRAKKIARKNYTGPINGEQDKVHYLRWEETFGRDLKRDAKTWVVSSSL